MEELSLSTLALIKAGDDENTLKKYCEKNLCGDNSASCSDNTCTTHHGVPCGINRCGVHVKL